MRILDIKVMRGPNYWSPYRHKLIVLKLDLEESEEYHTGKIDGFSERLEALMPSLYTHECSEKKPGGFFERVREGTWLGHVVEHVALELQTLAGMPCTYGRTQITSKKGIYQVVFAYEIEKAGIYAARAAVKIVQALESDMGYEVSRDIKELINISKSESLPGSTQLMIDEARKRDIPFKRFDKHSLIMFGQGVNQKLVRTTPTSASAFIDGDLASNKETAKNILGEGFIPVPEGKIVKHPSELITVVRQLGFPLVIKPACGEQGMAVGKNIRSVEKAIEAFDNAWKISEEVIVERFIKGYNYRFLLVNYKVIAVAKRDSDVFERMQNELEDLETKKEDCQQAASMPTKIRIDESTHSIHFEKNLTLNAVLPFGDIIYLKDKSSLGNEPFIAGSQVKVHPENIFIAERAARLAGLDICGIDIVSDDITKPLSANNGCVVELNTAPGLRMQLDPAGKKGRKMVDPVISALYPEGATSRIPIVAVTGTNGKTTTTRLIAHFAKEFGKSVGYATTDGIYIGDTAIYYGDCSGPVSAEAVLRDPLVDFAVLECARGGILRAGLGFDKCDISIITNITEDHLGLGDIETLEQMAKVKSVVAHSTFDNGFAILNADDDLVYDLGKDLYCHIALFSMDKQNDRLLKHIDNGGIAAYVDNGNFIFSKDGINTVVAKINEVPLTLEGKAECMIQNILPSILAAFISGFDLATIQKGLKTFVPGPGQTPGRMNIFNFNHFDLMVDYAHNIDGLNKLAKFLEKMGDRKKVGIITCPGDRRDVDIQNMGFHAAKVFDEIIIRLDKDTRGRPEEEVIKLICHGMNQSKPSVHYTIVANELDAIKYGMENAVEGAFIVVCSEDVKATLHFVTKAREKDVCPSGQDTRTSTLVH